MWRRRILKGVLGIAAVALLLTPGTARAQFFFTPYGSGIFGSNNLGALYARPVFPGMGRGTFPGFNSPYLGEMGGVNPYAYNPLLYNAAFGMGYNGMGTGMGYGGMGFGGMGMGYSTVLSLPGFPSSGQLARKRPTMEPALAVSPYSGIRQAAYDAGTAEDHRARIEVVVPSARAEVHLQGTTMRQTGTVREYLSPPLQAGSKYVYDVRVRWSDSEGEHEQTRSVRVWAGASRRVDFTAKE